MTDARDIDCPKCAKFGDDCGEHPPTWEELVDYWRNEAATLRKQLENAREALEEIADARWEGGIEAVKAFAREALKGQP